MSHSPMAFSECRLSKIWREWPKPSSAYPRKIAHHQVAERDKILESLILALRAAELHVDVVELEEQELVGYDFEAAELRDEVVDGHHLRQETRAPQGGELLGEEALRAVVVEHHQHLVGVLRVLVDDALCYLFQKCFHGIRVIRL